MSTNRNGYAPAMKIKDANTLTINAHTVHNNETEFRINGRTRVGPAESSMLFSCLRCCEHCAIHAGVGCGPCEAHKIHKFAFGSEVHGVFQSKID